MKPRSQLVLAGVSSYADNSASSMASFAFLEQNIDAIVRYRLNIKWKRVPGGFVEEHVDFNTNVHVQSPCQP